MLNIGICKLCLKSEKKLCNSHIIPESFYKPAYDEQHRINKWQADIGKETHIKKGLREYMLCKECEQRINKYEKYATDLWNKNSIVPNKCHSKELLINGLDYTKIKLFHLSVLWRSSVSQLPEFKLISLGPHEEILRKMIINNDAGPDNYYCIIGNVLEDDGEVAHGLMLQPFKEKIETYRIYYYMFGGCRWIYFTSSHPVTLSKIPIHKIRLLKDGQMVLPVMSLKEDPFIERFLERYSYQKNGMHHDNLQNNTS